MKIIVSHDVDHLNWSEHWKDTFIPGLFRRTFLEWRQNKISIGDIKKRFNLTSSLNQLESLSDFNIKNNVKATFFFGMSKGLNLSYNFQNALPFINMLMGRGFKIGLHGQSINKETEFLIEKNRFKALTGSYPEGIRNHYLRIDEMTHLLMNKSGYKYDSTDYGFNSPYRVGDLWEFPIQSMDGWEYKELKESGADWSLLDYTKSKIAIALEKQLPFYVINFHDIYFSQGYPLYYNWYVDLITYLNHEGFAFVNFDDAINELNG